MSEQGWKDFLHATGVGHWVVLHGGAVAVYPVASLRDAVALAGAVAEAAGDDESGVRLTASHDRLAVRLADGVFRIESSHLELARTISAVARSFSVSVDRAAAREVQVAIAGKPDDIDLPFWRAVLGYDPLDTDNALVPLGHSSTVWMQDLDPEKSPRHACTWTCRSLESMRRPDSRLRSPPAAEPVDDSGAPEGWILADRAGNKVCIAAWPDGAMRPDR